LNEKATRKGGYLFIITCNGLKIKQPPASSGCFCGVFWMLFIFGFCIIYLFRSYPYNMTPKRLSQHYLLKMFLD
jgi:hypothetical protein